MILATVAAMALIVYAGPLRAEILNDDEYGSLEIIDVSVIEQAADMFSPVGLSFNVSRGGPLRPGEEIAIYYRGQHERYVTLLDFSPDRKVKPLVMNELTRLTEGGIEREYRATIGDSLGKEYVVLIISALPLTEERVEGIALAPDEVEIGDEILSMAVNDFSVVGYGRDPGRVVEWGENVRGGSDSDPFIELEEFAQFIDYPLNVYPYNPWPYMYLYPYAKFRPSAYVTRYGPFSRTWYVFPTGERLQSNFWDYATSGWIDNGIWIIPPGGYWQGTFRVDDPYSAYYIRILPYLIRENRSYLSLQMEINGTLVQSSIDATGAIGWGQYWTQDPFAYYNLATLLHMGENSLRLYWPADRDENLELQMVDLVPAEVLVDEIDEARDAAEEGNGDASSAGDGVGGED